METSQAITSSWDYILVDRFVNELFDGVLGSLDPRFSSDYVIRKKHLSKVFKDLLQLKTLSPDRKETILNKLIGALPKYPHKVAYLEARRKMMEILKEELPDITRDLDRLYRYIDLQEVEQSLKIDLIKQKGYIASLREAINELILTEDLPPEAIQKYLLLDQALSLLVSLYEKVINSGGLIGVEKYGHYIIILLLRIYSILKNQESIENLEGDIIEIAPLVSKAGDLKALQLAASLVK
ncbi:hypothetical protein PNA2_0677 [Pyrococcus sp. NA2]|uniref:hypothetical protein n=1 Tax=Pyrococcus sp. (strain NA2) TaxID=342949 RepID=UPI000209AD35|nr:hypothetical protein [Pyrococcus sp. NA2]AEC51593.1 hypothetical protein PNA2_0677 [Pyrococcus sp. NA2]